MSNLVQDSEIWKDIPNYEGIYQISNKGQIKNLRSGCYLTISFAPYGFVRLCVKGIAKKHYVHRLLAILFITNPENKPIINHKDGDKANNSLDNLEWCDYSHNIIHAYENKLRPVGENHNKAKFRNKEVLQIREEFSNGIDRESIMSKFNLSENQYARIVYRRTWKYI